MKSIAKTYAIAISIIGFVVGAFCVYICIKHLMVSANVMSELSQGLVFFALALLCRCLPIYIREDYAIDMSFISNFATLLCMGPVVAASITIIASPFVVVAEPGRKKHLSHIFNTDPLKTAFNTANFTLSVFLGGLVFVYVGGKVGDLSLPGVLLPSCALVLTIIVVNSVLLITLFKLNSGIPFASSLLKNLVDFLPSVIAAAPIGYFIATFMLMEEGKYLVLFFILPLLLARFAFSMYIDAKQSYYIMLKTLTNTIEAKDAYTCGHSERVEKYAEIVAREMYLSAGRIENLKVAALLHDVGKIGIDEKILKNPERLTAEELKIIRTHPEISVNILKDVNLEPIVFESILHHHERYDGCGYPSGVGGRSLPIEVYILGVADTFDAITSERPYSHKRSGEIARNIIVSEKGRQFHPEVVDAFLRVYNRGGMELLEREELGVVELIAN